MARGGESKRVEDMLALTREGILALTREGWYMLQERHPSVVPDLAPPGHAPLPTAEQHTARSSRCPTYMVPGPRASHRTQGIGESDECGSGMGSSRGEAETAETASTGFSPIAASRESSIPVPSRESSTTWSASGSEASDRMQHVLNIDDDSLTGSSARFLLGHRDDWELQYMLNGIFDELRLQLESGAVQDLEALLQGARSRMLEWTVRRWQSSHNHSAQKFTST